MQVQQLRLDSEEHCLKLEVTQKEAQEVRIILEREKEQVRRELLAYVRELETLSEKLRRAEQQRRDAEQEVQAHERRNMEHGVVLAEVRHKVSARKALPRSAVVTDVAASSQGLSASLNCAPAGGAARKSAGDVPAEEPAAAGGEQLAQGETSQPGEARTHAGKRLESPFCAVRPANACVVCLTRRMEDATAEIETLSQTLSAKEAGVQRVQQQLEEKAHECGVLSRQLQQTLDDTQKEVRDHKCYHFICWRHRRFPLFRFLKLPSRSLTDDTDLLGRNRKVLPNIQQLNKTFFSSCKGWKFGVNLFFF